MISSTPTTERNSNVDHWFGRSGDRRLVDPTGRGHIRRHLVLAVEELLEEQDETKNILAEPDAVPLPYKSAISTSGAMYGPSLV